MKLLCDRQELNDAMSLAVQVVPARSTRPVLSKVCLKVDADGLEIVATDLEVGLRVRCERVDVEGAGRLLLDAGRTHAILRELPGDKVEIAKEDDTIAIRSEGSLFQMVAEDPEEFPPVPSFPEAKPIEISASVLEKMIRKTAFSAASEEMRYALNGVLFDLRPERLRLVATDGKRLAICERSCESVQEESARVVSSKAVSLLSRLGGGEEETIRLVFDENTLLARTTRAVLSAQLVQGKFPPYEEVIPSGLDKHVEFEKEPFLAALRRAALLTTKDSLAVRFTFTFNKVTLSSRLPGVGDSRVELPVSYEYDPLEIALNPHYVIEVLKVIEGSRFSLGLKETTTPCMIREGEGFRYVVMPIDLA
ncbi:DNA polymerase III subunit beta [Planctomycetota bacterium]